MVTGQILWIFLQWTYFRAWVKFFVTVSTYTGAELQTAVYKTQREFHIQNWSPVTSLNSLRTFHRIPISSSFLSLQSTILCIFYSFWIVIYIRNPIYSSTLLYQTNKLQLLGNRINIAQNWWKRRVPKKKYILTFKTYTSLKDLRS